MAVSGGKHIMALPLILAGIFEAACVASEALALAGLDAMAAQVIRSAAVRIGTATFGDSLVLGGSTVAAGTAAAGAAGAAALIHNGRITGAGVRYVSGRLEQILRAQPGLLSGFQVAQRQGAYFYPAIDGTIGMACSFVWKGTTRRFFMPIDRSSNPAQLKAFLTACIDGTQGKFYNPRTNAWRYYPQ